MSQPPDDHDHLTEPDLPRPLAEDLRSAFVGGCVDGRVDRAVMAAARRRGRSGRRPWIGIGIGGAAAAAAGVALVVSINRPPASGPAGAGAGGGALAASREDINADGRVDIIDVMALARAVRDGEGALDLTGDGRSDAGDVEALAVRIVAVSAGSGGHG